MAAKELAVKKYVEKLSAAERERLETMLSGGRHLVQLLTRARILLKADVGEGGEGWSDSQIPGSVANFVGMPRDVLRVRGEADYVGLQGASL